MGALEPGAALQTSDAHGVHARRQPGNGATWHHSPKTTPGCCGARVGAACPCQFVGDCATGEWCPTMTKGIVRTGSQALARSTKLAERGLALLGRPTGLVEASRVGDLPEMQRLLAAGADPDEEHPILGTPLIATIDEGAIVWEYRETTVLADGIQPFDGVVYEPLTLGDFDNIDRGNNTGMLLDAGADPNRLFVARHRYRDSFDETYDSIVRGTYGALPLPMSAHSGGAPMRLLLEAGADPNRFARFHPLASVCFRVRDS